MFISVYLRLNCFSVFVGHGAPCPYDRHSPAVLMNRDWLSLSIIQGFVKDMKNALNASNASRSFVGHGTPCPYRRICVHRRNQRIELFLVLVFPVVRYAFESFAEKGSAFWGVNAKKRHKLSKLSPPAPPAEGFRNDEMEEFGESMDESHRSCANEYGAFDAGGIRGNRESPRAPLDTGPEIVENKQRAILVANTRRFRSADICV